MYGAHADEVSAKYYETAQLLVEALRKAGVHLTPPSRDDDRRQIRNWLAAQNNQAQAFAGLSGPIYFDETQTRPEPSRVGRCVEGRLVSASIQIAVVPNPSLIDLDAELAAGRMIRIRQTFYWLQQVVYTGIEINQISRVDTSKGTFSADFYLWFRYAGNDAVRDVDLNAATEKPPSNPRRRFWNSESTDCTIVFTGCGEIFGRVTTFTIILSTRNSLFLRLTPLARFTRRDTELTIQIFTDFKMPRKSPPKRPLILEKNDSPSTQTRPPSRRLAYAAGAITLATLSTGGLFLLWHRPTPQNPIRIAVVLPLSGRLEHKGKEALDAVNLHFDEVNRQGGVRGHPLEVIPYDDADQPEIASAKAHEVAASQALVVIGHLTSPASLAGGKIYREASIPAITAFATVPGITAGNPYYFRIAIESSAQGHILAAYAKSVLGQRRARIIFSDEAYGRSLRAAFVDEFVEEGGELEGEWSWDPHASAEQHAAVIEQASTSIANGESGVLVLAVSTDLTKEVVLRLRRTGVNPVILGGTSLGSDFPQHFREEPEEQRELGYFTNNTYLASPLLLDSSSERSLEFSERLFNRYGFRADEVSAKYYEAALLIVEALRSGEVALTLQSRDDDRRKIREWLARQANPSQAIAGLTGPIYFDQNRSAPQDVRIGRCTEGQCVSAPIQLAAVPDPRLIDLDRELAAGHVIRVRQQFYWLQRVVYTGIDINQISRVDTGKGTFTSDFYLWFRYAGDDEVRSVDLNAATEKSPYDEKSPLLEQKLDGLHYSLYRVRGDFRSTFDFHDYPFDSQSLVLRVTNPRMTREQVIYAIDTFGLKLPRADGGVSQLPTLANWDFTHVLYGSDTLSSHSTRGQPGAFRTNNETQFSGFNVVIGIKRKTLIFLFKTLLPLLLLVLVVYVTLFFPASLTKERLTIAISAMLASAVLLTAINSQLTDVGYTTAIEYGFYAFFALCLFCVFAGLMTERLHGQKNPNLANRFDLAARIIYPLAAVTVFVCYYFRYH